MPMPIAAAGDDVNNRRSNHTLERPGVTLRAIALVVAPAAQRDRCAVMGDAL